MKSNPTDQHLPDKMCEGVYSEADNPDAHFQLAIQLVEQGLLEDSRWHARKVIACADTNWPQLESLGCLLFALGDFQMAYGALFSASRNGPMKPDALRMLAALFRRNHEPDNERRCIQAAAKAETFVGPVQPSPNLPNVLRLRSVEKSYYGIKTDQETGLRYCWLKGGHFSDANLIDLDRVNLFIATVCGENIEVFEGLPDFDLFVNSVSCADLDPVGLERLESFVRSHPDVPVINAPQKVLKTTRAENSKRLNALPNVTMPRTEQWIIDQEPEQMVSKMDSAGMTFPMIVRHKGTQTGKSMEKIDSRHALVAWLSCQPKGTPINTIDYVDCRWPDGYYHKSRAFFIDGEFFPVANLASDHWQIHSGDRYRVMSSTPSTQDDEQRYLSDPEAYLGSKAFAALHAIRDTIDLDFFGIDFTLDADRNVIVFEANAAMRHNFDHAENFPYTRCYLERISKAFEDLIDRRTTRKG